MKKLFPLLGLLTIAFIGEAKSISSEDAWNYVYTNYASAQYPNCNIWTADDNNDWLVIVNQSPRSNSVFKYDLYTIPKESSGVTITDIRLNQEFPDVNAQLAYFPAFDDGISSHVVGGDEAQPNTPVPEVASNTNFYAVIMSGALNLADNSRRFFNDCKTFYNVLRSNYSVPKENIYLLFGDGNNPKEDIPAEKFYPTAISTPTDWDGDGVDDLELACTRENLEKVFNELATKLTAQDNLVVFVDGHGKKDNYTTQGVVILSKSDVFSSYLMADEFDALLGKVNASKYIVMEPCNSGAFVTLDNALKNYSIITTACAHDEKSQSRRYEFDSSIQPANEFIYHWTKAFTREHTSRKLYGDYNSDGYVTFYEAYRYAKENDIFANGQWKDDIKDSSEDTETPQYRSNPPALGNSQGLYTRTFVIKPFSDENPADSGSSSEVCDAEISYNKVTTCAEVVFGDACCDSYLISVTDFTSGKQLYSLHTNPENTFYQLPITQSVSYIVVSIYDNYGNIKHQLKLSLR